MTKKHILTAAAVIPMYMPTAMTGVQASGFDPSAYNNPRAMNCCIYLTHLIAVLYLQVLLTIYAFPLDRY